MYLFVPFLGLFFMFSSYFLWGTEDLHTRISETAESILANRYASSDTHLEVRVVRTGGEIQDTGPLEVTWSQKPEIPRALLRVDIHSKDNLAKRHKGWALLYIAHFDSVLVPNRSIKNGELVSKTDLSPIWAETTRFHGTPLTPDKYRRLALRGIVYTNRHLSESRLLKETDLRNAYDVETGQQVILLYKRNGIALELSCKSRNQGFKGDIVKLFSPDTQHMYRARITGPQTAIWVETLE